MLLKAKKFTLVEVMIAGAISMLVLTIIGAVSLQLMDLKRDCMADMLLAQNASLLRQKILKTYKLSQADYKSLSVDDDSLSYTSSKSDSDWPSTEDQGEDYKITLGRKGLKITKNGRSIKNIMPSEEVSVDELIISRLEDHIEEVEDADAVDPVLSTTRGVKLQMILKMDYSGKKYYRNETINTVIYNGNTSTL